MANFGTFFVMYIAKAGIVPYICKTENNNTKKEP